MFQILKKTLSMTVAMLLIVQHLTFLTFASGDLIIGNITFRWLNTPTFAANPGTTFSIWVTTSNNLAEPIQSAYLNIDFGNNAGFSYQWVDQRTRIWGANVNNPIPTSAYDASTGLHAEITSAGTPQIAALTAFDMFRVTGTNHSGFLISSDIATYSNTLTFWFVAQKVSDSSAVTGDTVTRTVYANVKPHITDYYFEKGDGSTVTSQIQGDQAEAINLVVKAKDYNGCANMDGGTVTADLSAIGLTSTESLSYSSCDADGKTAIFKKTGISTLASLGDKTFAYTAFQAQDENANLTDPNDSNTAFDDEDKKTNLVLTIIAAAAPGVSISSTSDTVIGGPGKQSTLIQFSGTQWGEIKVAVGSDGSCNGGTTIRDWTGSGSYTANASTGVTILSSSFVEWSNAVYACVRNSGGNVGSATVAIVKDTVAPTFAIPPTISPGNVTTNDASISVRCSENGTYQVEIWGSGSLWNGAFVGSGSVLANVTANPAIGNASLAFGSNTLYLYCQDVATNVVAFSGSVNKIAPTPSMSGEATAFADNDADNDGLDGRDMTLSWNNSGAVAYSDFQSYRIFILPSATSFNSATQTYSKLISDKNISTWTWDNTLTVDSLGAALVSGATYKACIAILGASGQLGTEWCTAGATLTADTVSHPTILSAKFTSDTNLEVTTDATLDTNLSSHSGALLSFVRGGTVTAASVASVSTTKINFTLPALGSIAATGSSLIVGTGAIRANGGGYNNYFSSGSFLIADAQNPTITGFSKTTNAGYGTFYSGSVNFAYTFGEAMLGAGNTKFEFTRTSGNTDSTTHSVNITAPGELASGSLTKTIDLSTLSLVSGTTYQVRLVGKDLAGNSVNSSYITSIGYDSAGPAAPTVTDAVSFSTLTPTLSWTAPADDNGNGAGVNKYTLRVYNNASCVTGNLIQTYASVAAPTASQILTTLGTNPGTYSWNVYATDRMSHTGATSACDDFMVDTALPTISGQSVLDQTISSSTYAKTTDTLSVTATISNSDSSHVWLDMSSLAGNVAYNDVQCSAPPAGVSCTYSGGIASYGFVAGFSGTVTNGVRQVQFRAQNTSGLNELTAIASITVDTVAPSVSASAITSPNGGEVWGGTGRTITWNTSLVTDAVGIASVRLEYSTGAGLWNLLSNGTNAGSYVWDITSVGSRNDYAIRLTAFDHVGNSASDTSNAVFSIDRTAPTVPSNTLTVPNGGIYKGGASVSVLWNSGAIVDGGGLAANPITLEYSTNNGTNWTQIGTGLPNTGSYSWTVPSATTSSGLVRITATDTANNGSTDVSDANFIIDSTNPVQTITYAGGGGNTPQSGRKINDTGLDITLGATDAHLDRAYYQFLNTTDGLYWNSSSSGWLGILTWNTLCTDGTSLGTNLACGNVSSSISPTILNGKSYSLIFKSVDEAGNSVTSITHTYTGDTIAPNLSISTASGSYLANGLTLSGTSSDNGSGISSVKISIRKGAQYWDGSAWVAGATSLLTQTSNSYANWTYAFNPPLADADGQYYTATVTAYDNAYKTNNSTSSSIGLVKDASGPSIASDVFTFDTGVMYRGGNTLAITWNPAKITATGAGLATNPITLSYNFTGTIVTIASNIANSGSYNLSLPSVDTNSAIIIITADDTVGNISGARSTSSFTIDSLPPTIQSASTMDTDVDGRIDALQVTMSESVQDSSVALSDFSLGLGIGTPTGFLTGIGSDDDTFVLSFSNTGTTASAPTLSYASGSLVDLADNHLATVSNIASADGVAPRVQSANLYDSNGNGKMDLIKVQFGENMQANAANLFSINNALAGMSIASVSRNATNSIFDIVLNESTNADTSVGAMTLDFANNATYKDIAGNVAGNFSNQAIGDLAKPVRLSALTTDVNGNFKTDRIDVRFSENVTGNTDGEFTLSGLAVGSSKGSSSIVGDTLRIAVNETSNDNDTSLTPVFSYSGTSLMDSAGNVVLNMSNVAVSDGIAPKLLSRTTQDYDGNGQIDSVKLTFSENLGTNLTAITIDVAGYSVSGYSTACGGSTSGDAIACASLTEKSVADTDAVPAVRIVTNTALADTSGNLVATEGSGTNATDGAGPVIIGARYDTGNAGVADDTIYLTFSENLDAASVSGTSTNDFAITGGGALSANSTTAFASGNSATVTLGAGATALTAGTSKISIVTWGIADAVSNVSPTESTNNRVTVSSPVIINEVMWSGTGSSANQYVELKNIGTSSININGWVLENAGGNGVNLTLPNVSIAAGAIYLIAKSNESSSILNATPNLVSSTLGLSASQNNLILKSGSVVYDTAKANPWPEGNTNKPASMERRDPAGDGTSAANWYEAKSSVGFDAGSTTARGTPGTENIFDTESPIIGSFAPGNNVLLPTSPKVIALGYSDSGGSLIDTASATLLLQKWNGSSFADVTATYVNTGSKSVTQTGASYPTNAMPFGKYRATFNISDNGNNNVQQIIDFFVDQVSFTISGNSIDVGRLTAGSLEIGASEVTVTVQTLGAGFTLAHSKTSTLTATGDVNQIQDFDGTTGFGFDYAETGSGNTVTYAGTIASVNGGNIANYPLAIDPNGNRKTYVYKIKYGAKIEAIQAAGIYGGTNAFDIRLRY